MKLKFVRFSYGGPVAYGILEDDSVRIIDGTPFEKYTVGDKVYPLEKVRLLEPVIPSKIIAVGLNYIEHAPELGMEPHEEPTLFLKPPSAVLSTGDSIIYPEMSKQVEYEAELAIVMKSIARHVSVEQARERILGYTCVNDVTARDLQKKDGQWTRAKSFDTFAPVGPCIATDIDPNNLKIELKLNGEVKQSSNTSNMHFKPDFLVSFISHVMTLCPGDLIFTGTPPGVGLISPGDQIEVTIESIGTLSNKVTTI
ncbi:MAG TPA: fumarylacetoacetate hydrolase family protein [Anaerolineae bacterium]|nr:fumarylacetoacetate hydrolase family protein [Anaerolineae bacterium]